MRLRTTILLSCVLVLLSACGGQTPSTRQAPVLLRVSGSTSMQPLLRDLAQAYSARYKHVSFEFSSVGSTAGLEALRRGSVDLALVSRALRPEEETDSSTGKRAFVAAPIARDGIAVIVNAKNPVRRLSAFQLRNLFEGQTLTWDEVGGPASDVVVVSREDGSGTRAVFEELAMRGHRVTSTALVMPGSAAVRDYVAQHEGAIGYVSMGWLGPDIAPVAIDNASPAREAVEAGSYALTRPFLLVTPVDPAPEVEAFLQFATSPAGQAIVRKVYGAAHSQ